MDQPDSLYRTNSGFTCQGVSLALGWRKLASCRLSCLCLHPSAAEQLVVMTMRLHIEAGAAIQAVKGSPGQCCHYCWGPVFWW